MMIQNNIETLLRSKIGLAPNSIGSQKIARAIENRRVACDLPNSQSYWQYLKTNPEELQQLIECVTIPETWFFRDKKPFDFVRNYVINKWLPNNFNNTLNLLSVPCATGEEPFSLVMTLFDIGLQEHQFNLDAIDINKQVLFKAQQGFYQNNSFRQKPFDYRSKYFKEIKNGYQLSEKIRQKVKFQHGNILNPFFLNNQKYDLIFCRNLLIYLDETGRNKALNVLERLLKTDGILFVGSGETSILADRFNSLRQPFTFAYQKKSNSLNTLNSVINKKSAQPPRKLPIIPHISVTKLPEKQPKITEKITEKITSSPDLLTQSRNLANHGQLEAAITICEDYLRTNITSAEGYVLLGEISEALGKQNQAEQSYQKALYLQPNYYEALVHLALLKENKGDIQGAKLIRQRIERVLQS